jgi:hypothetical protein
MIAVAFRKPGTCLVGFAASTSWRYLYNCVKEVTDRWGCTPEECEYSAASMFMAAEITINGDEYVVKPGSASSNMYELVSERLNWRAMDWAAYRSLDLFHSSSETQPDPFDPNRVEVNRPGSDTTLPM